MPAVSELEFDHTDNEELPPAARAAFRMAIQAYIRSRPREEGEAYIWALRQIVEDAAMVHPIIPLRSREEGARRRRGQAVAAQWLGDTLIPLLAAALPPANGKKRKG